MGEALSLRHTVAIKMYETIGAECGRNMYDAGVQASVTLNDVGAVLLELRASTYACVIFCQVKRDNSSYENMPRKD